MGSASGDKRLAGFLYTLPDDLVVEMFRSMLELTDAHDLSISDDLSLDNGDTACARAQGLVRGGATARGEGLGKKHRTHDHGLDVSTGLHFDDVKHCFRTFLGGLVRGKLASST
jgi:hypothetical protein